VSGEGGISAATVVVASPDSLLAQELARRLGGQVRVIAVSSAYEAAAELLSGQAGVLVADLRLIHGPHTQLLQIARARQVAMLGVGVLPAGLTGDDLAGMTLAGRADLAPSVQAAMRQHPPDTPPASAQAQEGGAAFSPPVDASKQAVTADAAEPAAPQATLDEETVRLLLAGRQEAPFRRGLDREVTFELELREKEEGPVPPKEGKKPIGIPTTPPRIAAPGHGLLTPEELDALLGGD